MNEDQKKPEARETDADKAAVEAAVEQGDYSDTVKSVLADENLLEQQQPRLTKERIKQMSTAQKAELLKKNNPEAYDRISQEVQQRSEKISKVMSFFTWVVIALVIYIIFFS